MQTQIRYIFKPLGKDYLKNYKQYPSTDQLRQWIDIEANKLEVQGKIKKLKAFIKKEIPNQSYSQYIKITNQQFLETQMDKMGNSITVQFFLQSKKKSIETQLKRIGTDMGQRHVQLKQMVAELKDEANQFYTIQIISKVSSRTSSNIQQIIDISLFISDPLVTLKDEEYIAIHNDQVNVVSHIQRLKRASMSDSSLTIRAKRYWCTKNQLIDVLSQQSVEIDHKINIVQLITQVRRINGNLMLSLEKGYGEQQWVSAQQLFAYSEIDLLIIIGVGAILLKQLQYPKPLILISTISLQQKRIVTQHRNILDSQNSYNDFFSQSFLEIFYQNLFKRIEITQSIDLARRESNKLGQKQIWCCCLHEHAPDCNWKNVIQRIGYIEAHRLFKHTFQDWKKDNFYSLTQSIQEYLIGSPQACSTGQICCYQKLGQNKLSFHRQVGNILYWNQKNADILYQKLQDPQKRLNRFESLDYDKPTGRKRPLTLFKLIKSIIDKQSVLIVRSPTPSLAKRYLSFAREYLTARNTDLYFCQLSLGGQTDIRNHIRQILLGLKSNSKLGHENLVRFSFFLQVYHNPDRTDKFYQRFLRDCCGDVFALGKAVGVELQRVKILLLTIQPNFDDTYPTFKLDEPQISQKYHYVLSKYSYEYIRNNFAQICSQIKGNNSIEADEVENKCDDLFFNHTQKYVFLGFISLFSQDGLYLTKHGRYILQNLFGKQILDELINHQLPVELINLSDCLYLQLHKSYLPHFHNPSNGSRGQFQKKQLEYYYVLLRCYNDLALTTENYQLLKGTARLAIYHEGLFSIDILTENSSYDERIAFCEEKLRQMKELGDDQQLSPTNFRPIYHLAQTEKIIKNFMRKKKNFYVNTSKSFIRTIEPPQITYLFWNIIHLAWKGTTTLQENMKDRIIRFQTALLQFLSKVEATSPFAEVARLQLYFMIGKIPPKTEQLFQYYSRDMIKLLGLLRTYSNMQQQLSQVQLTWGQTHKFKELVYKCANIAEIITSLLKNSAELQEDMSRHPMFQKFTILAWKRQLLKLTERKIICYFQLSKLLKTMLTKSSRVQKQKQFHKQFKLNELVTQFRTLRQQLPSNERDQGHRVLIEHYLQITMNEVQADRNIISQLRGKLSSQYLPLFQHLCEKIQQKTLFNQKGLIVCARARTILVEGKPYLMSRKRNLTMLYLKQTLQKLRLKISYFTLNSSTLGNLKSGGQNKQCQLLSLILTIDSPNQRTLSFGQDRGINAQNMPIQKFAQQIKQCKISILVISGRNSLRMCKQLVKLIEGWQNFPNIIALQSNRYSNCDQSFHNYNINRQHNKSWQYICNEVSQISFDLLTIALVYNISIKLTHRSCKFTKQDLDQKIQKSRKMIFDILQQNFQCASEVLNQIVFQTWASNKIIDKITPGILEDLTAKFYSSENNLHDQNYYENIGRGYQVNKILQGIVKSNQRYIQIIGQLGSGKSTLIQQVCWISQTKNLFKFGVFRFNINQQKDPNFNSQTFIEFVKSRDFRNNQSFKSNQTSILIALDNIDQQFISTHRQILKALKSKSVTLIYSVRKKQIAEIFKNTIENNSVLTIDINNICLNQIYGILISNIKIYNHNQNHKYSKQLTRQYDQKIRYIMKSIESTQNDKKLNKALQLLKQQCNYKKQDDKINIFLHFYKKNFQGLIKLIQNVKQIKLKII